MTSQPTRVRAMQLAVLLTAVFVVMALVVLVRDTPIAFAVFMFVGQPLFLVALALLLGAVVADLRAKQLL
jgi:hypothetical protein